MSGKFTEMKWFTLIFLAASLNACSDSKENKSEGDKDEAIKETQNTETTSFITETTVDLPKAESVEIMPGDYLEIQLDRNNHIYLQGKEMEFADVRKYLEADSSDRTYTSIKIDADKNSSFEFFTELATIAKDFGLKVLVATK